MADPEFGIIIQKVQEEVFTPNMDDGSIPPTIRSGKMREWLHANAMDRVIDITFPEETEEEIIDRHGLEADRMASMTEEEAKEPIIVALWPDGSPMLVDGGHRRWFWHKRGIAVLRGWAVPHSFWQHFIFRDDDFLATKHYPDGSRLPQRRKR